MTFDFKAMEAFVGQYSAHAEKQIQGLTANADTIIGKVIVVVLILTVTLIISGWLSGMVRKMARRLSHNPADRTLPEFFSQVVNWLIMVIGIVAILSQLGVQTTSIIAVLGAASLAIGLALQGTLSNVASGIMLLVIKPYVIGDVVRINDISGTVYRLGLFTTELVDANNLRINIPNSKIISDQITNFTHNGTRRIEMMIGVDYDTDLDHALKVLKTIAESHPKTLEAPVTWTGVRGFADSSVTISLQTWVQAGDHFQTETDLFLMIKKGFDSEGIILPYPHQVQVDKHPKATPETLAD
ncbi:mechanosensitive ion channel family protein [Asticcacaulis endophyticus]|uniref:Small-conductance mechanosensitive channel n=1 Tax=Asticcacaulis endophyticus TaxID=1395890 RepID=A0A918UYD1_9CAUL|nr:mechanosensitive ion channel family protein [Asticcacaulis endophyticus]GGZ42038.1 mechanosensitive ion channel protein [Asticcacaulis endophyticus]